MKVIILNNYFIILTLNILIVYVEDEINFKIGHLTIRDTLVLINKYLLL